jgi:CubicO group peptidase (beta-lactamase class C family)
MLYSTGNTHLLSAILTRTAGRSTLDLARDWLGRPLGMSIPPWLRNPQGIYFGGNDMLLSPRSLLRFAEMFRQGGRTGMDQVLAADWVRACWSPQAPSFFTGDLYGYGWFMTERGGHQRYYAWEFGGQMAHVVPDLALTVVTSDPTRRSGGASGHARTLHDLVEQDIIPALS